MQKTKQKSPNFQTKKTLLFVFINQEIPKINACIGKNTFNRIERFKM
jgi:hypothetical protein